MSTESSNVSRKRKLKQKTITSFFEVQSSEIIHITRDAQSEANTVFSALPPDIVGSVFVEARAVLQAREVCKKWYFEMASHASGLSVRFKGMRMIDTTRFNENRRRRIERILDAFKDTPQLQLNIFTKWGYNPTSAVMMWASNHVSQMQFKSLQSLTVGLIMPFNITTGYLLGANLREFQLLCANWFDDHDINVLSGKLEQLCPNLELLQVCKTTSLCNIAQLGTRVLQACPRLHTLKLVDCDLQTGSFPALVAAIHAHETLRVFDFTQSDDSMSLVLHPNGDADDLQNLSMECHRSVLGLLPRLSELYGFSCFEDTGMAAELLAALKGLAPGPAPGAARLTKFGVRELPRKRKVLQQLLATSYELSVAVLVCHLQDW